jgi:hypothetical protein
MNMEEYFDMLQKMAERQKDSSKDDSTESKKKS